jgi:misacylated tRNA(Ala) deacylase
MHLEKANIMPGFAAPSPHLVKDSVVVRVVRIGDIDAHPCGGIHIDDISEIGEIIFMKAENKERNNRRIYYTIR